VSGAANADPGGAGPIESPCVDLCVIDAESGLCEGCGRSLEEIAEWSTYTSPRRREIIAALAHRKWKGNE